MDRSRLAECIRTSFSGLFTWIFLGEVWRSCMEAFFSLNIFLRFLKFNIENNLEEDRKTNFLC